MKLKISILLTILFSISTTAFGQKKAVKPKTQTKITKTEATTATKPAETKITETQTAAVKTPTVPEILAKYVQAIGGKQANEKIKSRMTKGTVEIPAAGIKGTFESYTAAPNKSVSKNSLPGIGDIIEGFDGQTAWSVNPLQGNKDKQGEELEQTKLLNNFYREINLAQLYPKMELKGTEKVGENDTYVVVGTPKVGTPETFYFDTKSGLLVRQDIIAIQPEGNTPTQTFFEDFRAVDGIKTAHKIRTILPQFEVIITTTEIKNNVVIEDAKFAKPKA